MTTVHDVPLTRWRRFRMVVKVVELRLRFVALMAATGAVFGYWDTLHNHYEKWSRPARTLQASGAGVEFYCPMHPTVVRDDSGICPICGMPLSKRVKGEKPALAEGVLSRVSLGPTRVAQAGIRTRAIGYESLGESLTTVGTVEFDERRLARIASKVKGMGRVEKLLVNFTGTNVKAGQPLAELYSPELYQATQELLLAHRRATESKTATARSVLGDPAELVRIGREKLELWGVTAGQVDEILKKGRAEYRLPILAPIGGVVVRKNVVEGQYVAEGEAMFEVADLSRVWVQAQVFEDRFATVQVGQAVEASVVAYPGESFHGHVAFVDPVLNPATRTVNVRYDLENADLRLRPGMFAAVTLRTTAESKPLEAGGRLLRLTASEQKVCPVTQLKLGAMGEPVKVEVEGNTVWACCGDCSPKLKATPAKYLVRLQNAPEGGVLGVPESAVIDTGTKKMVYVEVEPGVFEGREVVLGPRSGDRYPVLKGLSPGESVAEKGAFLIDAETRLNPSAPAPAPKLKKPDRSASAGAAGTRR